MKLLQHRLLEKLQAARGELASHPDPAFHQQTLETLFAEAQKEMQGSIALNFRELIGHILLSFDYDIDRIIAFLQNNVGNPFDDGTLREDREEGFDMRYGTQTGLIVDQLELPEVITIERIRSSSRFHPTPIRIMRLVLKMLPRYQVKYDQWIFIDIGAGLGRNLLLASGYPFKRIIGIEISSFLCEKAYENIRQYNSKVKEPSIAEMYCTDVLEFEFPQEDTILYFWEPFTRAVMEQLLVRIEEQTRLYDTKFMLIFLGYAYLNDIQEHSFRLLGVEYEPDVREDGGFLQLSFYTNR